MSDRSLDPEPDPRDSPDSPEDEEPDTVATPEGDNEFPPDVPLEPSSTEASLRGLQVPYPRKPDHGSH